MWHAVAPRLAERFMVIAAALPGDGDSFRPPLAADHFSHSKRAIAEDLLAAMRALGHPTFGLAGHYRGGRVGYRMALDHPDAVTRLAVLDIVPTGEIWSRADWRFALGYWHWSFLAQPAPAPERLILGDPDAFWGSVVRLGIKDDARYPPEESSSASEVSTSLQVVASVRSACRSAASTSVLLSRFSGDWDRLGVNEPTIGFTRRRSFGWPSRDERLWQSNGAGGRDRTIAACLYEGRPGVKLLPPDVVRVVFVFVNDPLSEWV